MAVIGLGIFGGNAMKYQSSAHNLFVRKMQVECSTALQLCTTLSPRRTPLIQHAGQDSPAYLQYADHQRPERGPVRVLRLAAQETYFSNLYSMLDEYETKLITGMTTGDYRTSCCKR